MISIGAPAILLPNSSAAMRLAVTGPMQLPLQYWPEKSSSTAILILLSEICAAAGVARIAASNTAAPGIRIESLLGFILAGEARSAGSVRQPVYRILPG